MITSGALISQLQQWQRTGYYTHIELSVMHQGELAMAMAVTPDAVHEDTPTDNLYDLASVTKLFTTTALLALLEKQGMHLQTPLVDVVPEFGRINPRAINGGQDPHSKQHLPTPDVFANTTIDPTQVTLFHLLTHTSGLPPWRDVYTTSPPPPPPTQADSLSTAQRWENALDALVEYEFVGTVGDAVRYSDVGLMLLGEVIARLHGGTFEEAIAIQVIQPAALQNTCFNPVRDRHIPLEHTIPTEMDETWRKRRVWGEVHDENACGIGGVAGHAGLFATARDVAQFGEVWLHVPQVFGVSDAMKREATTAQVTHNGHSRGLGWVMKSADGSSAGDLLDMTSYGHTGFTGTSLWIDPTRELVVSLMSNRVYNGRENPDAIHNVRRYVHDAVVQLVEAAS